MRDENYTYQAYKLDINENIIQFTKEGLGIRRASGILKIVSDKSIIKNYCYR